MSEEVIDILVTIGKLFIDSLGEIVKESICDD